MSEPSLDYATTCQSHVFTRGNLLHRSHVVIVMPAYNEAEGLEEFITEIYENVAPTVAQLSVVVVNDRSTDRTSDVLTWLESRFDSFSGITALRNQGHGPTAISAYKAGLRLTPDLIVHVDGDGQFLGRDFVRLIHAAVVSRADVVHGVRHGRSDPWFRKLITALVSFAVALICGRRVPDVNTPFRAYDPSALSYLLTLIPEDAQVPHVHFSIAEKRAGLRVAYLRVASIPRRGQDQGGTMWGAPTKSPILPPKRLRKFVWTAAKEVWRLSFGPRAKSRKIKPLSHD